MTSPNLNKRKTEAASSNSPSQRGEWPSASQFFGQIGIVLVIVVVWAALFAGYMAVVGNALISSTGVASSKPGSAQNAVSVATSRPAANVAASEPGVNAQAGGAPDATAATTQTPAGESSAISFARDVQPLLQQRCVQCHGGRRTAGGVALSTYDQVLQNVLPGNSAGTKLVQLIKDGSMPRNAPPLLPSQIDTIARWIDAGAPNN